MTYHILGKSDLRVSAVSFGCMSLTGNDSVANLRLLRQVWENGINFFDTADLYEKGENEKLVGKAFQGMRQRVVIATKGGNQWRPDGSGWDWNPRKKYLLQAVEGSLQRLQTDYLDLYQLHGGTLDDPIDEIIDAFELLQQQGKIRYYGISSIRPNVIRAYVNRSRLTSVMMQYSLFDRRPEESCLDLLQAHQVGMLARGSLAQGLLAGKPTKSYLDYSEQEVAQAARTVQAVAGETRSAAAVAVGYVLAQPAVTTAVLGLRTSAQLAEAIHLQQATALLPDEVSQLRQTLRPNRYEQHR